MPLSDLRYLAQRSKDRIDRITKKAADLDARGDQVEVESHAVLDKHEEVLVGVAHEIGKIDEFNREMQSQLGNEPAATGTNASGGEPFRPKAVE